MEPRLNVRQNNVRAPSVRTFQKKQRTCTLKLCAEPGHFESIVTPLFNWLQHYFHLLPMTFMPVCFRYATLIWYQPKVVEAMRLGG